MGTVCNLIPRGSFDRDVMHAAIRETLQDGQSVYFMRDRGVGRVLLCHGGELIGVHVPPANDRARNLRDAKPS